MIKFDKYIKDFRLIYYKNKLNSSEYNHPQNKKQFEKPFVSHLRAGPQASKCMKTKGLQI